MEVPFCAAATSCEEYRSHACYIRYIPLASASSKSHWRDPGLAPACNHRSHLHGCQHRSMVESRNTSRPPRRLSKGPQKCPASTTVIVRGRGRKGSAQHTMRLGSSLLQNSGANLHLLMKLSLLTLFRVLRKCIQKVQCGTPNEPLKHVLGTAELTSLRSTRRMLCGSLIADSNT